MSVLPKEYGGDGVLPSIEVESYLDEDVYLTHFLQGGEGGCTTIATTTTTATTTTVTTTTTTTSTAARMVAAVAINDGIRITTHHNDDLNDHNQTQDGDGVGDDDRDVITTHGVIPETPLPLLSSPSATATTSSGGAATATVTTIATAQSTPTTVDMIGTVDAAVTTTTTAAAVATASTVAVTENRPLASSMQEQGLAPAPESSQGQGLASGQVQGPALVHGKAKTKAKGSHAPCSVPDASPMPPAVLSSLTQPEV